MFQTRTRWSREAPLDSSLARETRVRAFLVLLRAREACEEAGALARQLRHRLPRAAGRAPGEDS